MKNKYCVLTIAAVAVIMLSYRLITLSHLNNTLHVNNNMTVSMLRNAENSILSMLSDLSNSTKIRINQSELFFNTTLDTIRISEICNNCSQLILLFRKTSCNDCVEDELTRLKEKFSAFYHKMSIIAATNSLKDYAIFLKENSIGIPIYSYFGDFFDDQLASKGPFYFVLDPSGGISNLFFPLDKEITENYLNNIFQKIQSD